jgi:UDP-glucuronate 4-epimerase
MAYLVTGAAGFIGFHCCQALLARGETVIGVDNLNAYYDPTLKNARLEQLSSHRHFTFYPIDIVDKDSMFSLSSKHPTIKIVIHLAAQAGVRHSLTEPFAYSHSNLEGHLVMLEWARHHSALTHFIYASSSSVYGANKKIPFSIEDPVDEPQSLYAATKKAAELMSYSYSHLYQIPTTGLRFFTVYGPWGRPDMSVFLFVKAILEGRPITLFNQGQMSRDFTEISDIIEGILCVIDHKPPSDLPPVKLYNIGHNHPEPLRKLVSLIEESLRLKASILLAPLQPGDVLQTFANIDPMIEDFEFRPKVTLEQGIPRFVSWYKDFYGVK